MKIYSAAFTTSVDNHSLIVYNRPVAELELPRQPTELRSVC